MEKQKKQKWQKLRSKLSNKLPSNIVGGNKAIPKLPISSLDSKSWLNAPIGGTK